jgi:hypothetical protein
MILDLNIMSNIIQPGKNVRESLGDLRFFSYNTKAQSIKGKILIHWISLNLTFTPRNTQIDWKDEILFEKKYLQVTYLVKDMYLR